LFFVIFVFIGFITAGAAEQYLVTPAK